MVKTYNVYGGHPVLSLIPDFLLIDAPDFGPAVKQLTVTLHFASRGPAKYSLDDRFRTFHTNRATLPKVVFQRGREKMEIEVPSNLMDGHDFERLRALSLPLFAAGVGETLDALGLMASRLTKKDSFNLDAFLDHLRRRQDRIPSSPEALAALAIELKDKRAVIRAGMSAWERLGIDWRDYHPDAQRILDHPFFWEQADDDAPHGNDTGADLLSDYRHWLKGNAEGNSLEFFNDILESWGFPKNTNEPLFQVAFDEAAIALAFAELKLKGRCHPSVASQAMEAVRRQRERALSASGGVETLDLIESKLAHRG